jgi:hypothetical protein
MEHSVIVARAAAESLVWLAFSEAATLPCSSSAGQRAENGGERRQPLTRVAKLFERRAVRSSRCEESLLC